MPRPTPTLCAAFDPAATPEAFLIHGDVLYFSRPPAKPGRFPSAVETLVRGVSRQFPGSSLRMLRERIHTNHPPSPVCRGMVRISAKRLTEHPPNDYHALRESHSGPVTELLEGGSPVFDLGQEYVRGTVIDSARSVQLLDALCKRASGPRRVGAFARGPGGELLEYSWSRSESDQTAHAEVNLARVIRENGLYPLPAGSSIWTSLEPCAMCAAQILGLVTVGSPFSVFFREHDTGPAVHETCLVMGSNAWREAGEPDLEYARLKITGKSF
ncbi:MAG: hypothetical protein EBX52_00200 [Proteobacteria bacterium]|nr:hypothetical protein [Pseudomonadota bacterium]